jgi:hypothetical protein
MIPRDWRVDSLRGYFLVLMTLAHLPQNPLQPFTSYTFGYASAPDGFVFLSGLVSTWVYLRVRNKHGQRALETRILSRTRDVYLLHIFLLSASIAEAVLLAHHSFQSTHPVQAFLSGSLLLYQPTLSDILPMYCICLLFTPIVLDQMMKGRAWLVGMTSTALWCAAQWGIGDASQLVPWISLGSFNILAWQAYFVAGQYLGCRSSKEGESVVPKSRGLLVVCITLTLLFFLDRHSEFLFGATPVLKFALGPSRTPARFLDAACLGYVIWWLPRTIDRKLMTLRLFNFFNLLGRHSLQVFAASLFITAVLSKISHHWVGLPASARVGLALGAVITLVIPAWLHEMYRKQRRERRVPEVEYLAILRANPNFIVSARKEPATGNEGRLGFSVPSEVA